MPHFEQTASVENENTRPMPERGDGRFAQNIAEESDDVAAESVQAQEAAAKESALVLERIRQLPDQSLEEKRASEASVVERPDERLVIAQRALDDLFEIAERRSPSKFTLSESTQILIHKAQDFFKEKKVLDILRQELPLLAEDIGSAEHCGAVVQLLERMVNGMEGNEQIKTYVSANRQLETELITLATQILADNAERFVALLEGSAKIDVAMSHILSGVIENEYGASREQSEKVVGLMTRLQPYIETQIDKMSRERDVYGTSLDQYALALRPLILSGDEESSRHARERVADIFIGGNDPKMRKETCQSYVYAYGTEGKEQSSRAQEVVRFLVSRMGLDPEKFYDADKSGKGEKAQENYINNILAAQALESSVPGSVKKLSEEYGIQSFGRYPKELLLRQLETEDDLETPYGIMLNPREDWNGGFYNDQKVFSDFANSAQDEKMNVRVFECESKIDAAKKLIRLQRKYGAGQKIQFAIIGGHGNEGLLEFGQEERKTLKKDDLEKKAMQELRGFFSENATIVLNSCSTGDDFGLGEMMSELEHINVVAPDQPTSLRLMTVQRQGEECIVSVEYKPTKEGKNVLRPARSNIFARLGPPA